MNILTAFVKLLLVVAGWVIGLLFCFAAVNQILGVLLGLLGLVVWIGIDLGRLLGLL
jgi:hypothetical protein